MKPKLNHKYQIEYVDQKNPEYNYIGVAMCISDEADTDYIDGEKELYPFKCGNDGDDGWALFAEEDILSEVEA